VLPAASFIDDAMSERARQQCAARAELEDACCAAASRGRAACIGVVWVADRSSSRGVGDGRGPRGSWLPLRHETHRSRTRAAWLMVATFENSGENSCVFS